MRVLESSWLPDIARLRSDVWAHQLGIHGDPAAWRDDHDEHARHFVAFVDEALVGAVRLCVHDGLDDVPYPETYENARAMLNGRAPFPVWSRLVVAPNMRGRGIARALDAVCLGAACDVGGVLLAHVEHGTNREDILFQLGFEMFARDFVLAPWGIRYGACAVDTRVLRDRLTAVLARR